MIQQVIEYLFLLIAFTIWTVAIYKIMKAEDNIDLDMRWEFLGRGGEWNDIYLGEIRIWER